MRIVVGITGASGAAFGVEFVRRCPGEKFLILTKWGRYVLKEETRLTEHHLAEYVKRSFSDDDLAAPFSSGSTPFDALVILPCSVSALRCSREIPPLRRYSWLEACRLLRNFGECASR